MKLNNKVELAIKELKYLEDDKKEYDKEYRTSKAEYTKIITEYMAENNTKEIYFKSRDTVGLKKSKCILIERTTITYNLEKLKKRIKKEILNRFVRKSATINDIDAFVAYMKQLNADPNKIKSLLTVNTSIEQSKLDQEYNLGNVTMKDVKGCYTIETSNGYLKFY